MPFFTVIIPTYNRAHIIGETINSVINQSFQDFELLIIDDGSTDDTRATIATYTDNRIKYIYQENGERGKARNTGVKNAKGKYVFFLDSDDLIYPQHLQLAFDKLNALNLPAFFHSRYELLNNGEKKQVPSLSAWNIKRRIEKQNLFACQFFLDRTVALEFPFSENRELKIGEDWLLVLQIAQNHELHISNKVTSAIVVHGERSMEVASTETILTSKDIMVAELQKNLQIEAGIIRNVQAELLTLAALSASIENNKKLAFKLWFKGIMRRSNQILRRRTLAIFKKIMINGQA
ncbi:glycosyltransferase family 2 protein [Crocinitomix catalasitica]|uniref:glycosyltransferase family 2 protein n=1 Tax=Crocinitomix catalasitica TaxID=184607 RepID=UPI0004828FE0|nr:glycosyltransferase family 2 protein [Crocinitomix catalasitica]